MRFRFGTDGADPARVLVVDGVAEGFRGLSHWPGQRTPPSLRHDLSTGIALAWARCTPAERLALLGPAQEVANTHYDTDGVLSVFAVMRPYDALARSHALLAAAATGDFGTWNGEVALAVDLSIMALPRHPQSPVVATLPDDATDAERWEASYLWAVEHLPGLLDAPWTLSPLWAHQHQQVCEDVAAVEAREGVQVETFGELDLAAVRAERQLMAIALHHAAGEHYRLLVSTPADGGHHHRFCFRDESWFELVTISPAPRVPLDGAMAELQRREEAAGGRARWWASGLGVPVVQLGHCEPDAAKAAGFFLDPLDDPGTPSRLGPDEVRAVLTEALAAAG
jgi:hypothetical protein